MNVPRKYLRFLGAAAGTTLVVLVLGLLLGSTKYRATTLLLVGGRNASPAGVSGIAQQLGLVQSSSPVNSPAFVVELAATPSIRDSAALRLRAARLSDKPARQLADEMRRGCDFSINQRTSTVLFGCTSADSAEAARNLLAYTAAVDSALQSIRRGLASDERTFLTAREQEVAQELQQRQSDAVRFMEANRSTSSPALRFALDRLESKVQFTEQSLSQLRLALNQARIEEARASATLIRIQPVIVSKQSSVFTTVALALLAGLAVLAGLLVLDGRRAARRRES